MLREVAPAVWLPVERSTCELMLRLDRVLTELQLVIVGPVLTLGAELCSANATSMILIAESFWGDFEMVTLSVGAWEPTWIDADCLDAS